MGFTIIETNDGYAYKGMNYKWGEGLIQFVNFDFSNYFKCIKAIREDAYEHSKKAISSNLPDEMAIIDFFSPLLAFKTESLHINLQKDLLLEFFSRDDLIDEFGQPIKENMSDLDSELNSRFLVPIKLTQSDYIAVIKSILNMKNNEINLGKTLILKINENISQAETIFDKINKDYISSSTFFNRFNSIKKIKSVKENSIEYENTFYRVEEFCRYELYKVLENKINILQCPFCDKFFMSEHGNANYCSPQCRKKANSEKLKNDPYFSVYDKKRKKILNHHYSFGQKAKDEATQKDLKPLTAVYNNYRQNLGEKFDKKKFEKFINEINKY